jgi:hypothetical protein
VQRCREEIRMRRGRIRRNHRGVPLTQCTQSERGSDLARVDRRLRRRVERAPILRRADGKFVNGHALADATEYQTL